MEYYIEQPGLGGRVPFSFGEELALCGLLGFCGLFSELEFCVTHVPLPGDPLSYWPPV